MNVNDNVPVKNTDRELWRERPGDFYSDSIYVAENGSIGINCGGTVYEMPLQRWHQVCEEREKLRLALVYAKYAGRRIDAIVDVQRVIDTALKEVPE